MWVQQRPFVEQKLYAVLENCKRTLFLNSEIPKDDRLILRQKIKSGDQALIQILSDAGICKLIQATRDCRSDSESIFKRKNKAKKSSKLTRKRA